MGWLVAGVVALLALLGLGGLVAIAVRRGRDEAEFSAWARRAGWTLQPPRPDLATRFHGEPFQPTTGLLALGNQAAAVHVVTAQRNGRPALANPSLPLQQRFTAAFTVHTPYRSASKAPTSSAGRTAPSTPTGPTQQSPTSTPSSP